MINLPATVTYSCVVSRETVCIALTMAALNALKVMAADIMNAYIALVGNVFMCRVISKTDRTDIF